MTLATELDDDEREGRGGRYYEFNWPSSNISKFWAFKFVPSEQRKGGVAVLIRWGRIGTSGQEKLFEYDSDAEALRAATSRADEKVAKGYVLVSKQTQAPTEEELRRRAAARYYLDERRRQLEQQGRAWESLGIKPPPPATKKPKVEVKIETLVLTTRRKIDFEE